MFHVYFRQTKFKPFEERAVSEASLRGTKSPSNPSSSRAFLLRSVSSSDHWTSSTPPRKMQSSLTLVPSWTSIVCGRCLMKNGAVKNKITFRKDLGYEKWTYWVRGKWIILKNTINKTRKATNIYIFFWYSYEGENTVQGSLIPQ